MSYAEVTESELQGSYLTLFEAAHPEIYCHNAFRVTGLSVEATCREISRHVERHRMMQKFNSKEGLKTPLALNPPPDEDAMREAVHKLQDPEKRLIDEFFWFWPHQLGQSKTDKTLSLLASGDTDSAAEQWFKMEQSSESYVSMHNLSVLFHCLALDLEQVAISRKLNQKELETLEKYWELAFKRWDIVLDHEPFWSRLTARIRALEDPRLTTGLARRIRTSLPLTLLSINGALAVRYAETGNLEAAKRQLEIMKSWELSTDGHKAHESTHKGTARNSSQTLSMPGPLAQKALREALEPIRQRIKSICKNAESHANKDPSHGDGMAREVIEQTKPMLATIDILLPPDDAMRDAAHDEVAFCALRCQVSYGNKTENWKVSLELLELALPIAVGQATRDRIQDNIKTVKGNLEYGTCWFCRQNPSEDGAALDVKMYGDVTRTPTWNGTQIQWRQGTVKVPRCGRCKSAHDIQNKSRGVGAGIGALLGIGGCIAIMHMQGGDTEIFFLGVGVLVLLAAIGSGIGFAIVAVLSPERVRPLSAKSKFPSVKQLLGKGWRFGERPNTQ